MNLILIFLVLWLSTLSFVIYRIRRHYHKLTSKSKQGTIDQILEQLINDDKNHEKEIVNLKKNLTDIEKSSHNYFQKLGIIRFNPFERIGGEQSFVLALLNKENTGVVINFIYTREGVRIYLKQVKNSKGVDYELSQEEKEAIKKSNTNILPNIL